MGDARTVLWNVGGLAMDQAGMADQAAIIASELAELCRAEDYETLRLLLDMARLDLELAKGAMDDAVEIAREIGGALRDPREAPLVYDVSRPISRVL
jgi:hypothetical protein